jgi:Tol biopolymer transport system component
VLVDNRNLRMGLSLMAALATIQAVGCVPTRPTPVRSPGSNGNILFVAPGGNSMDLWTVPAGGGAPVRITRTPLAHESDPAWSPDGRSVAFARRPARSTTSDIWVMNSNGSRAQRLTHDQDGPIDREPAWSPDGSHIVWVRSIALRSSSELWVMRADGSDKHRLVAGAAFHYDASPDWSPDGRRIVFTSNRGGGFPQIFTVESDGSDLTRLTRGPGMNGSPAWSPDGRRIAFERSRGERGTDLWLMDADGSERARLTRGPGGEAQPAWAPTGDDLVFNGYPPGGGPTDLFLTSAHGSSARRLATGPMIELSPDWGAGRAYPSSSSHRRSRKLHESREALIPEDLLGSGRLSRITSDVRLHRFHSRGSDVYALDVRLDGEATVDVALASDSLASREVTSRIAARHGALAAVNGDFALPSGKPLHPFAADGDLKLSSLAPSRNFAVSANQADVYFGRPVEELTAGRPMEGSWPFDRWNSGTPSFAEAAAYSPPAGEQDRPPKWACAARLLPFGKRRWGPRREGVARNYRVDAVRCAESPLSRHGGVVLAARPTSSAAFLISSLRIGDTVALTWSFGWKGVADSIGGFPQLVRDGRVRVNPCGGLHCQLHPRTGLGVTSEGHLLMVVVDGRQEDSRGITLVEFARLFRDMGAIHALNLDGGGSTTMVVRGSIVNDPSGQFERPSSSAVLILPGRDTGQSIVPTVNG